MSISIIRKKLLKDGLELKAVLLSVDGTPNMSVDSTTVEISTLVNGEDTRALETTIMSSDEHGEFYFDWHPTRSDHVDAGNYIIRYIFTIGSTEYLVYDELEIIDETNNKTWYSAPQSGITFNRIAPSANQD